MRENRKIGMLHGVPVSIKDVTLTAGIRTTFGSKLYENFIPDQDALLVERLKREGAIILGKTNTPEFAAGGSTFNKVFGITRNPWNTNFNSGGSSGGAAAAIAAGLGPLNRGMIWEDPFGFRPVSAALSAETFPGQGPRGSE